MFIPWVIMEFTFSAVVFSILGAVFVYAAAYVFLYWQPNMHDCPADNARWWRQGTVATSAATISGVPLYLFGGM